MDTAAPALDQKRVARALDKAAARADAVGARPASAKQCWFLAGLIVKWNDTQFFNKIETDLSLRMTAREASGQIDRYLQRAAA